MKRWLEAVVIATSVVAGAGTMQESSFAKSKSADAVEHDLRGSGTQFQVEATMRVGDQPCPVCVDSLTDSAYLTNLAQDSVSIIDGTARHLAEHGDGRHGTLRATARGNGRLRQRDMAG